MSYYYTLPDGRQMTQEQWDAYEKQRREAEIVAAWQAQNEAARLVSALSEAYKACTGFMNSHPELVRKVGGEEAAENDLYLKLRQNLERADSAPRCEKVREDGTVCGCPQMKGYAYCYAHERMLKAKPEKLQLPALEDANSIQLAIMMVQKALIDDEISEKKAGLLLYSLQLASSNAKWTTFGDEHEKEVVTEMPEEEAFSSQYSAVRQEDVIHHGGTETRRNDGSGDTGDPALRWWPPAAPTPNLVSSGSREAAAEQISHPSQSSGIRNDRASVVGEHTYHGDTEPGDPALRWWPPAAPTPNLVSSGSREAAAEQISHPHYVRGFEMTPWCGMAS